MGLQQSERRADKKGASASGTEGNRPGRCLGRTRRAGVRELIISCQLPVSSFQFPAFPVSSFQLFKFSSRLRADSRWLIARRATNDEVCEANERIEADDARSV